jgi:hypothetical protein
MGVNDMVDMVVVSPSLLRHPLPLDHRISIRPHALHPTLALLSRLLTALPRRLASSSSPLGPSPPPTLLDPHGRLARLVRPRGDLVCVCALFGLQRGG